jgi:hypothetical protein
MKVKHSWHVLPGCLHFGEQNLVIGIFQRGSRSVEIDKRRGEKTPRVGEAVTHIMKASPSVILSTGEGERACAIVSAYHWN